VLPPIGAQGLNLGLRDAVDLCAVLADARNRGHDLGAPETLAAYERRRRADLRPRVAAVDLLNRSLLSDLLPAQLARGAGLWLLAHTPPLRRALLRQGLGPRP
jgi:2-octaprenyl-6-methoxyphenol hydroxylase